YLLAIFAAGLLFWRGAGSRQRAAVAALLLALVWYGARATAHAQAMEAATDAFGRTLPPLCASAPDPGRWMPSWPIRSMDGPAARRERASTPCLRDLAALPTFLSPLTWHIVADLSNAHEVRTLHLVRGASGSR